MAKELGLIPNGKKATLEELLPGTIFAFGDDCIAVKSEYRCENGVIEAFIIDSGEQFWGGAKTAKEQNELMVQPLAIDEVDAVEVEKALKWLNDYAFTDTEQVYTNGAVLVPLFRVKQALEDKAYNGLFEG